MTPAERRAIEQRIADNRARIREIDRRILLHVMRSVIALGFLAWYSYELAVALRPLARALGWV